jgi:hypothetical protein
MRLIGGHPQAAWIERVLNSDPRLASLGEELQTVQRELAQRRQGDEIARLYALDSDAARRHIEETSLLDEEETLRITLAP